jgi:NADH:ubiquinone reductase (H+-translocating)
MPDPGNSRRKAPAIVILGAGFAGMEAAEALGRAGLPFTLIDQNNHLFQPLLYQVATTTLQTAEIAAPIRAILSRYPGADVLMDRVIDIDADRKVVTMTNDSIPYDYLIVATGARTSYFGNDALRQHSFALKTLDDAVRLRHQILTAFERAEISRDDATRRKLMTFVLVGGGPNGVGAAVATRELAARTLARDFHHVDATKTRVIIVEAGDTILPGIDAELVDRAMETLSAKEVEVRTNAKVVAITPEGVDLEDGHIEAGTVIWTAGVAVPDLAAWLGAEADKAGRIVVGEDLTVPERPNIWVVGDAARSLDEQGDPHPGLAALAKQQGRYAAAAITAACHGKAERTPFHYSDYGHMVPLGRFAAIAHVKGWKLSGLIAWLLWAFVHVLFLMDWRRRLMVTLTWIWSLATKRTGSRIIINRDGVELPQPDPAHQPTDAPKHGVA